MSSLLTLSWLALAVARPRKSREKIKQGLSVLVVFPVMPIPMLLSILEILPLVAAVKGLEAIAPSVIADWKLPPLGGSAFTDVS